MDPATLLIIDDQPLVLSAIARFLEQRKYLVHTAGDGQAGLSMVEQVRPDLIITDIRMPKMDGWEFVRKLRAMPAYTLLPVIILTDNDTPESRMRGFQLGADDYVSKSTIVEELEVRVARALERSRQINEAVGGLLPAPPAAGERSAPAPGPAAPMSPGYVPPSPGDVASDHIVPIKAKSGDASAPLDLPPLFGPQSGGKSPPPAPPHPPATPLQESEATEVPEGVAGMRGTLDQIGLASIITLLGSGEKSGVLTLNKADGGGVGRIFMRDGEILKIRIDGQAEVKNVDAIASMMLWENATFTFSLQDVTAHDEIHIPIEHLLMEASRLFDEDNP